MKNIVVLVVSSLFIIVSCNDVAGIEEQGNLTAIDRDTENIFEKVDAENSGLLFENTVKEDIRYNRKSFDFDYFYNGAGVGIEDLNNDGLPDIFFCGNQVGNKLFINQGNLKFKDISATSGINIGKIWSNGVTFVDIDNDGWKDVYVSQGGPNQRLQRKNLLFINQKNGTFKESAEAYGLADMGVSTQAAFFDFDKDGDLDCIVMNENELYGIDPINLYKMVKSDSESEYFNSSHLYRNDQSRFVDITKSAGIQRPIFGLGLSVSDINADGWLDIYISSDYYIPDALFINNKNGTFSDQIKEYTKHTSYYGMGVDIADINNDALQDIFVLDMASSDHVRSKTLMASMSNDRFDYLVNDADFHHQYMYNSLQLNLGNNKYSNIAQLSEMGNTDWSWSVLMSDFDNDELKDIYITNGYRRYALDNDLQTKVFEARNKYGNNVPLGIKKRLYEEMPSEKLPNILYQNKGSLNFKNVAKEWGIGDFSFSNGAASGDLDNDGDLDIVVNNMDENTFLYKNLSSDKNLGNYLKVKAIGKNSESFVKIKIFYNRKSQVVENKRVRGYMSASENVAHFGLGKEMSIDTVRVIWASGEIEEKYNVNANSTIEFNEKNAVPDILDEPNTKKTIFTEAIGNYPNLDFTHSENFYDDFDKEVLLPYKQSHLGPSITTGDINGDGRTDIFIGGASGQSSKILIQGNTGFIDATSEVFQKDKDYEDMEAAFFDFDNDSDLDLYVVSGGNEFDLYSSYYTDRIYINDGKGKFTKSNSPILTPYPKSGKTVAIIDFDKDGDNDILVGNRIVPKNYPKYSPSILYENSNGELKDVTLERAPGLKNFGIINKIIATDFNNDGWEDFIAVGEWTTIGFFENQRGNFIDVSEKNEVLQEKGWWFSVNETDINNDGLKDYIIGNAGLNLKFKASKEKPFKIYADDFDGNGTNDIVLSKKNDSDYVPVRGRECSSQQMPFIQKKFPTYNDFAKATLLDIYGEKLSVSYQNEVTEFRSILLVNKGYGVFEKQVLPIESQMFPILDCVFYDINKDGYKDAIVAGNIYETEVETPRLDAFSGVILISNGKNGYSSLDYRRTGLYLKGNVKSLQLITTDDGVLLLNTANNGPLGIHKFND